MTAVAEVEPAAVHAPGTDLTPYQAPAIEEYRPRIIMAPEEASALDKQLRAMMLAVLKEDVDYGVIPGTGTKPSLLKPGAEKLLQWFGFGHDMRKDEVERDADGARIGVTYRCIITKDMPDGRTVTVATCEGYAGYDEDRFYTSAEEARAKAEAKERKFAQKDQRAPISAKWEGATEYRAPWNSVIKMAQKRALVGATLQATSASTLFTQDVEDMRAEVVSSDGQFTEAATAAIMRLPQEVRADLDKWTAGKRWPSPDRWTPEQWCTALQTTGFLSAKRQAAQQHAQASPAGPAGNQPDEVEAEVASTILARTRAAVTTEAIAAVREDLKEAIKAHYLGARVISELTEEIDRQEREIGTVAAA